MSTKIWPKFKKSHNNSLLFGVVFFYYYCMWGEKMIEYFGFFIFFCLPLFYCVWDNHLFISKMIWIFPPNCLVPKQLKFSVLDFFFPFHFWSLCSFIIFFIFLNFFVFWFIYKKKTISMSSQQEELINDFEMCALIVECVKTYFFVFWKYLEK